MNDTFYLNGIILFSSSLFLSIPLSLSLPHSIYLYIINICLSLVRQQSSTQVLIWKYPATRLAHCREQATELSGNNSNQPNNNCDKVALFSPRQSPNQCSFNLSRKWLKRFHSIFFGVDVFVVLLRFSLNPFHLFMYRTFLVLFSYQRRKKSMNLINFGLAYNDNQRQIIVSNGFAQVDMRRRSQAIGKSFKSHFFNFWISLRSIDWLAFILEIIN